LLYYASQRLHLHAHTYATALTLEHFRGGKKIGELGRLNRYRGYGADQSFVDPREVRTPAARSLLLLQLHLDP